MKAKNPFSTKYSPKLDTTPELDANHTRLCLEWVGILRWAVELDRLDMYLEVSLISSQIANPRCGHLKEILHIFAHLKRRNKLTIYFDPCHLDIDEERLIACDWQDFYPDTQECWNMSNFMTRHI